MLDETTDDVGAWLRTLLKPRPRSAREVLARLEGEGGPPDLVQELRRLIATLLEEATTVQLIADTDGSTVEAFLTMYPSWRFRQGITQFSAADPTWGSLYGLSKPAARELTTWIRSGGFTHAASNGLEPRDKRC
jgi:hypothetical protein